MTSAAPAATPHYRRLPGRVTRLFSIHTLALADDHLLKVENMRFTERYKRFYFHDIQAVLIRRTATGLVWSTVWAFLALALLLPIPEVDATDGRIVLAIAGGFFLLLLVINLILGPTCSVHIVTAIQTEELPSLNRIRRTRRVVALLTERIRATQGETDPARLREFIEAKAAEPPIVTAPAVAAPAAHAAFPAAAAAPPPTVPRFVAGQYDGWPHWLLNGGLVAMAVMEAVAPFIHIKAAVAITLLGGAGLIVLAILALIRQRRGKARHWLAIHTWVTAVLAAGAACVVVGVMTVAGVVSGSNDPAPQAAFISFAARFLEDEPAWRHLIFGGLAAAAGMLGLAGCTGILMAAKPADEARQETSSNVP